MTRPIAEDEAAEAARLPIESRGDGPCDVCGTLDNIVWFTESPLWNQVCRPEGYTLDPILCVTCFVARAEKVIGTTGWALIPEEAWYARRYVTDDSERATVEAIAAEADANDLSTEEVITTTLRQAAAVSAAKVAELIAASTEYVRLWNEPKNGDSSVGQWRAMNVATARIEAALAEWGRSA